ncbi:MAG: helicase-related protein, partial [Mesorhizobium sp.]
MNIRPQSTEPLILSGRDVTAVLGPTNTGKTHLAIERMVAHESGVIGLPLRLLAREVYARLCEKVGANKVSLVTGEEKIQPAGAKYSVCTVEAMPRQTDAAFVAIDEVQLAGDLERGHIFTDRILHLRGRQETLLLGAATMHGILQKLLKGVSVVTRPRLSHLAYAGSKKLTRLPRRTAIVAFSADEVYAIAELIRRQQGGAAVVLGALSPRTRNAQVALYQSGDVDYLVATDAIGMGLNLDVDHVAFAQNRKFDGYQYRQLTAAELGQIAGRAGRHMRDGTFGVTGRVDPFDEDLVQKLEAHDFEPVKVLQWRTARFDFASLDALQRSIETNAPVEGLTRALPAVDAQALDFLSKDGEIRALATNPKRVELLWEACALPDYRRIAPAQHADLIASIYMDLARHGHVDETYMAEPVRRADATEGDIDTLSHRIAQIRTWTFVSNRPGWLADPAHWQEKTREIEDRLSDALHERLTKRFVDRRTSVLMRRLRENTMLDAEIDATGTVLVEGHHVGELQGFRFTADQSAGGEDAKAVKAAAQKALGAEFEARAERFAACANGDIALGSDGTLRWIGAPIGTLVAGEDALKPRLVLLADEQLTGPARDKVAARAERVVNFQIESLLKPLVDLRDAEQVSGIARGIAFQLVENFGLVNRRDIATEMKSLEQEGRAALRRLGVRFGAYHVFVPSLIKPAPAGLITLLWALK